MIKCTVILYFILTGEIKPVIFEAQSCNDIYQMVDNKVENSNVVALLIEPKSEIKDED